MPASMSMLTSCRSSLIFMTNLHIEPSLAVNEIRWKGKSEVQFHHWNVWNVTIMISL